MSDLLQLKEHLLKTLDAVNYLRQFERDGRVYDVGDKVTFTNDDDEVVPGIIHGVRYQTDEKGNRHSFEYIVVHEDEHRDCSQGLGRDAQDQH